MVCLLTKQINLLTGHHWACLFMADDVCCWEFRWILLFVVMYYELLKGLQGCYSCYLCTVYMNYSTICLEGYGLTEGETAERLWSYLRKFSKITKEIKPKHRTDLLTDGLLHYVLKLRTRIGNWINHHLFRRGCRVGKL